MPDYKRGHRAECPLIKDQIDNYLEHKEEIEKVISAFTTQDTHKQVDHNQIFYVSSSCEKDIYFLTHCLYNAKTELYDRILTDMRSKYDSTEAFIPSNSYSRSLSNLYSYKLYERCKEYIEIKTYPLSFDCEYWRRCVECYNNLSAQGWIDLYERLIKEGRINKEMLELCEPCPSRKGE